MPRQSEQNPVRIKPTAIDLFCGAGGLSEGLRQAGFEVLGAVDSDPVACNTYKMNHNCTKVWQSDVRTITGATLMRDLKIKPRKLDLIAACPPCQGFSTIRTKNGYRRNRDDRNDLIFEVLRIVRSLKPTCVMLENVSGLASSVKYLKFRNGLTSLGYKVKWDILNTAEFRVPQRRKRLVLLASLFGDPQFAQKARGHRTVRQAIGNLSSPARSRDALHNYPTQRSSKVKSLIRRIPPNGGSRSALGARSQLLCHVRMEGFKDVYGRMSWDKPAPTITGGCINPSKGRFLHPRANRAITLREAALLQSFPPTYHFSLEKGRYAVAALIGNALPPEFIRRHAIALRKSALHKNAAANQ